MTSNIIRGENVVWRQVDDEVAVVTDDGQVLCTLNKTAALVWQMLDGTNTVQDIADNLCKQFNVPFEEAYTDVKTIIEGFMQTGIANRIS